jgi:hypothetical protein
VLFEEWIKMRNNFQDPNEVSICRRPQNLIITTQS